MNFASGARSVAVRDRDRGQLFHPLDARYVRVSIADLNSAMRDLCRQVDPARVDCVLGFPEGGTPAAFSAAQILERPLVLSSLKPHELPNEIHFDEPHASLIEGRRHYIYALNPGDRVLIVEDEITTGNTILNAIRAMRAAGVQVDDVLALLATEDADVLAAIQAEAVRLTVHERIPIAVSQALLSNTPQ